MLRCCVPVSYRWPVLSSYRRVFAHPGAAAFSLTGLVARLPISMMTLGIVLLVSSQTGSYALAGGVAAAYVVGNAVFAIPHGRLADRFGQGRVLYVDSVAFALTAGLMIVSITEGWSLPLPHLLALLNGAAMPQIGTMVRGRWAHLVSLERDRHTAFAVEGIVDEAVFVTGPALVTFLSTLHAPATGLVVAAGLGAGGAITLALQRRTEPPAHPTTSTTARAPMPWAMLVPLTLVGVALGSLFGALEVATVALADEAGRKSLAGLMLGVFALGSLISAVISGARTSARPPLQRARAGMTLLAVGALALPLLPGLALVTLGLFLAGLAVAPTLIALFSIIEATSPRSRLNEAMGFVQTGVAAGLAPGAWLTGVAADRFDGSSAFWVGGISAVLAALAGLAVPPPGRAAGVPT